MVRSLVEDAGTPLPAALLAKWVRVTGLLEGEWAIGGRDVGWSLDRPDGVTVTHRPLGQGRKWRYTIGLVFTSPPYGGDRWWWACPACQKRVEVLYLPGDRDRLACRKCCGLVYASQYSYQGVRREKPQRPSITVTRERRTRGVGRR